MFQLVHALALVAASSSLGAAALRAASPLVPGGRPRVIAATVIAAAISVAETLVLGLAGLGASTIALTGAAVLTWLAATAALPRPERPVREELRAWLREDREPGMRLLAGAAAGLGLAWIAFGLRYPSFGSDGVTYHLPQVLGWVSSGHPGTVRTWGYEFPVGNYPLTNEVLLTWPTAIARSFVPAVLWSPLMMSLLVLSGWSGLRELRVPRLPAALAVAAVACLPAVPDALRTPGTDLPSLAWLVAAAALCAAASRRPPLVGVAALALGLALGTKTTAAPLAVVLAGVTAWSLRGRLAEQRRVLLAGALGAVAVGGLWYVGNAVAHGSPLWPFARGPWGDPLPTGIARVGNSFLSHPGGALDGRGDFYVRLLGGGIVLGAAVLAAPLIGRSRAVLGASATAALALLAWGLSPVTGVPDDPIFDFSLSSTRYLLPALAAGALALALAARDGGRFAPLASGLLGGAVLASILRVLDLPFPLLPGAGTLAAGVAGGVVVAAAFRRLPLPVDVLAVAAAVVATIALAAAADGFLGRHTRARAVESDLVARFLAVPGFAGGDSPVAFAPQAAAGLAGDRLDHRLEFIGREESCARVRERTRRGWVVIRGLPLQDRLASYSARACMAGTAPAFVSGDYAVYGGEP